MGERTMKLERLRDDQPVALGVLIHDCVRKAVEQLVQEELAIALGALKYRRSDERSGYRNGTRRTRGPRLAIFRICCPAAAPNRPRAYCRKDK